MIRFGSLLAPSILPVYRAITDAVGAALGIRTELVTETSYETCRDDVNEVCFVCSLPLVTLEREGLTPADPVLAPVLSGERYQGRPIYYSDVIVHAESDVAGFDDLRGRSWAYNEPLSHSGYGITRFHLLRMGETEGFFGDVVEAGYHQTAIEMVASGVVDAAAIDSQVLEVARLNDPSLRESLRVVETLGPSTIQPMTISRRVEPSLRDSIVEVVVGLHDDPDWEGTLASCLVERFVPVSWDSYEDIRLMLEACTDAGFMELR